MIEHFEPRPQNQIDALERQTDRMALLAGAVKDAVTDLALHCNFDPKFAGELDRAAFDAFGQYVPSGPIVPNDIKMMAYDAVDDLLRERGYKEPEYAEYFLSALNKVLGHPDIGTHA
jgi:hypothetical protein